MADSHPAVVTEGLKKSFGKLEVLKGIDLTVEKGSVLALLGPNGAGKTTAVRILTTLLQPDAGKVMVGGYDVVQDPDHVRSIIGLTGQYAAVDERLTGLANLEMIGRLYHLGASDAKKRAAELIERFDLVEAGNRAAKTYSGGMRRRLDLAASLIISPPILFLDEPTTGLDPNSRVTMWGIIEELVAAGTTVLLTTQYLEEADQLADQIAVIDHGVVIAKGTADELKKQVGGERLDLTLASSKDFQQAAELFKSHKPHLNEEERSISFEVKKGIDQLHELLTGLKGTKINVTDFSMHRPTLDDVFIKLTGRSAESAEETTEKAKGK